MKEKYYWSAKKNGFYLDSIKEFYVKSAAGWPDDSVEISERWYNYLLTGQTGGKVITSNAYGYPVLSDPVIDWKAQAESHRLSLLTLAKDIISDWRTELQLGMISDDDKASLEKWMTYIKALKALDITSINDEAGYRAFGWPDKPA
ncbi:tail fiber assembly protein [Enterobacter asburiae]